MGLLELKNPFMLLNILYFILLYKRPFYQLDFLKRNRMAKIYKSINATYFDPAYTKSLVSSLTTIIINIFIFFSWCSFNETRFFIDTKQHIFVGVLEASFCAEIYSFGNSLYKNLELTSYSIWVIDNPINLFQIE